MEKKAWKNRIPARVSAKPVRKIGEGLSNKVIFSRALIAWGGSALLLDSN